MDRLLYETKSCCAKRSSLVSYPLSLIPYPSSLVPYPLDLQSDCSIRRRGLTLLEMLVVLVLVAITAAITLPRFSQNSASAKKNACYTLKGHIEVQAQLWHRNKGIWPAANLSDIGAEPAYFPEGLPTCPVDGSAYTFDQAAHRVVGHMH